MSFSSTYQDFIPLKIISLNGDLLWQETLQMIKGKNRAEVDVSSLASGIYLVRIGDKTKKFIKS
ncbi:MAG: T9SS type A sorting domain-containing protein [Saprospiraceae bacterium]|nr:T9SS type A sorting domain-containing protein [Saprospiraceae bacterium]